MNIDKINKIKEQWGSPYFVSLGIHSHLCECLNDWDRYKSAAIDPLPKEELEQELNKELMDLLVLLEMHRENIGHDLYEARLDKFDSNYAAERGLSSVQQPQEFNWDAFSKSKNKIAVHCATYEEALNFGLRCAHYYKRQSHTSVSTIEFWNEYKEKTAFSFFGSSTCYFYQNLDYTVIEWADYMSKENVKSTKKNFQTPNDFDWEAFEALKCVAYCPTYEEAADFCEECARRGYDWYQDVNPKKYWEHYDKKVCFSRGGAGAYMNYKEAHFKIYRWAEYMSRIVEQAPLWQDFHWDDFKQNKIIVNCRTYEETRDFCERCVEQDVEGFELLDPALCWGVYDKNLTFSCNSFCECSNYDKSKYVLYLWSDYMYKDICAPAVNYTIDFDLDAFMNGEVVINCETLYQVEHFHHFCCNKGISLGEDLSSCYDMTQAWEVYEDRTCFSCSGFESIASYAAHDCKIFRWRYNL